LKKIFWIIISLLLVLSILFVALTQSHTSLFGIIDFGEDGEVPKLNSWQLFGRLQVFEGKIISADFTS
jgi:hypothetical protein